MSDFDYRIKMQQESLDKLRSEYEAARDFTAEVLAKAQELGIEAVGIGKTSPKVQKTPWSKARDFDLFAMGYQKYKVRNSDGTYTERDGGCIVWKLAKEAGIYAGCGNSDQAQINQTNKLVNGIYEFEDGKWTKTS